MKEERTNNPFAHDHVGFYAWTPCGVESVVGDPVDAAPTDLIVAATPDEINKYGNLPKPTNKKPTEHQPRLKFQKVYKSPGYPVDPKKEESRTRFNFLRVPKTKRAFDFDQLKRGLSGKEN